MIGLKVCSTWKETAFSFLAFEGVSFHFEMAGDLLDKDLLDFLDGVPEGMFQFEIGIQTMSPATQALLRREQDIEKTFTAVRRLVRAHRVHVHCDLIFGLPGETLKEINRISQYKPRNADDMHLLNCMNLGLTPKSPPP